MQINTSMSYHFITICKGYKTMNSDVANVREDVGQQKLLHTAGGSANGYNYFGKWSDTSL